MRVFLRTLYCTLNLVIVLALIGCLLTQYINPITFPYFELLALGFPIIVVLNIIASICWIAAADHKRYFLASIIPLMLSIPTIGKYFATNDNQPMPKQEQDIKVLSYNVMAFNYLGWRENKKVMQEIFDCIEKENPDIICFQEYHNDLHEDFIMLDSIKQQLNLSYTYNNKTYTVGNHYFQGNIIFSRYPIVSNGKINFEKTGNSTIWADIVKDNDTIRVFNSHLESYRLSPENKQTINELGKAQNVEANKVEHLVRKLTNAMKKRGDQTDEFAKSIAQSPYPIISCGDFNTPPCSYVYTSIVKSGDLNDAFLEAGSGIAATFNWWPQLRLDYILTSKQFECKNFKRIGIKVSDHFPITCTMQLNNTK